MDKRLLTALPLSIVAFYGSSQVTAQGNCVPADVPPVCQPASRININNDGNVVAPRNICIAPGATITVGVTPRGTTAIMHGKGGGWPYASNGGNDSFTITAPMDEGEYNYNVTFNDGSCVDPRITIKR